MYNNDPIPLNKEDKESKNDITIIVKCTLLEFYYGCTKSVTYTRKVLTKDGKKSKDVDENRQVEVMPGYSGETTLRFPGRGHEEFAQNTTALVVKFEEEKQPGIQRKGNDLIQICDINLVEAIQAQSISIVTLTGDRLKLSLSDTITPQTRETVEGHGMPIYVEGDHYGPLLDKQKKGDLFIVFNIKFPETLTQDQKDELNEIFAED